MTVFFQENTPGDLERRRHTFPEIRRSGAPSIDISDGAATAVMIILILKLDTSCITYALERKNLSPVRTAAISKRVRTSNFAHEGMLASIERYYSLSRAPDIFGGDVSK